jgi:hypothetical protein
VGVNCCHAEPPDADASVAWFNNDNGTIVLTDYGRDPWVGDPLRLIEDDNLTLSPGTYYFSDVRMVGQATLTVTGSTAIYVDEAVVADLLGGDGAVAPILVE